MASDGNKAGYTLPIISPATPWYLSPDGYSLYFFSQHTGLMNRIGFVVSYQTYDGERIADMIIGWRGYDFRLWNTSDTRFRQGIVDD